MKPKFLSQQQFVQSFSNVPRLAICVLVKNERGELLLTKRGIPPFQNTWHYPGSFLLKGEKIEQCLRRVIKEECGLPFVKKQAQFMRIYENLDGDPRGHVVDLLYTYITEKVVENKRNNIDTKERRFFTKLPSNIAFHHDVLLKEVGYV